MYRWLLLLLLFMAAGVYADERILDFHSAISISSDGSMQVTETIRVRAQGQQIRRGIYRDFPTDYHDRLGNRYRVDFEVLDVVRDGYREDYHTERLNNGMRVYIGSADRLLQPGEYSYTLSYRTNRQLGFFADHDELYWNVTGNGWSFPIDHAAATVQLPASLRNTALAIEAYTGPMGSTGRDYRATQPAEASAWFETSRALGIAEGLTVVVGWPKGHVQEPSQREQLGYLLRDNTELLVAGAGLLLLTLYYLVVWFRVGRDPAAGLVIPQYEPPAKFSPASLRFIQRMGYDHKTFATALVGLAVKGLLHITYLNGYYSARRDEKIKAAGLGPGEHALLAHLFAKTNSIAFKSDNHNNIKKAIDAHKMALQLNYEKDFFATNRGWLLPGYLLTFATVAAYVLLQPNPEDVIAMMVAGGVMFLMSMFLLILVFVAVSLWHDALNGGGYGPAIAISLFLLPFLIMMGFVIVFFVREFPLGLFLVLVVAVSINALFYQLIKAPTHAGRKLLDHMEGLRLYLDVAEKDELQLKHPPDKTPELFERLLPYAMAMDVEQRWAERFTRVFARLSAESQAYNPHWYRGSHFDTQDLGGFAASLGGHMSSTISSSSSAPGSSSGSSAGGGSSGSSGGGGGGGGGGGW
jgi:uncharacterized membrane protein YgcG